MAPVRPALAQSESKARFFERLGLDEDNELHRRIYAMMKVRSSRVDSDYGEGSDAVCRKKLWMLVGD